MNVGVFYIFYIQRTEDTYKNLCFNLQVKLQPTETVSRQGCQQERDGNAITMLILHHLGDLSKDGLFTSLRKLDGSHRSFD